MSLFRKLLVAAAVTAGLAVAPTAATAEPVHIDINNAVMDLGQLSGVRAIDSTLTPPDPPATLDGDLTGNTVTIPQAGFQFPEKQAELSAGVTATIDMFANEDMTGTYDSATGQLVLDVSLRATVGVLGSNCEVSPIELTLSTEGLTPYVGERFTGGLAGAGAIVGNWSSLPPVTGGGSCGIVSQFIAGPGGIWMSQDIQNPRRCTDAPAPAQCGNASTPPSAAPQITVKPLANTTDTNASFSFEQGANETQLVDGFQCRLDGAAWTDCSSGSQRYSDLSAAAHTFEVAATNSAGAGPAASYSWTVSDGGDGGNRNGNGKGKFGAVKVKPKTLKVKKGKKGTLTVKVKNTGDASISGVKICPKAPKKFVKAGRCLKGSIAAGKTMTKKFKVKVTGKAKKGKRYAVKFKVTGKGVGSKSGKAMVKVK